MKRPNRGSRGHEFGWDTLNQFCKLASEKLELPVRRLVRGHDHVPDRWQEYPEYADNGVPVLTINAMGRLLDGEPARRDGRTHPFPVVARFVPDQLPEVVMLPLDPAEVERAFPRPQRATEGTVKLVLQCAMCGTHHPVGTSVCSTCRASGVTQLRLMFECPTCGNLGISPSCEACLPLAGELPYSVVEDEELIVAEEIEDEADFDLSFDDEDEADEKVIVDLTEDDSDDSDDEYEYEDDEDEDD